MADKICTNCGYEGKAIKRPDDSFGEDDGKETKAAFDKLSRQITVLTFIPIKPLAMLLAIPMYIVLWPIKRAIKGDGKKWCPNCGLPLMVSLKSDAGWMAKRKEEIKAGIVTIEAKDTPKVAFGKEIALGDDRKPEPFVAPRPEKLPSLNAMVEESDSAPPVEPVKAEPETVPPLVKPKPPVDPESW